MHRYAQHNTHCEGINYHWTTLCTPLPQGITKYIRYTTESYVQHVFQPCQLCVLDDSDIQILIDSLPRVHTQQYSCVTTLQTMVMPLQHASLTTLYPKHSSTHETVRWSTFHVLRASIDTWHEILAIHTTETQDLYTKYVHDASIQSIYNELEFT